MIDILRASRMQTQIQISKEIIVNLSENGVSPNIFIDLFSQSIDNTISPLLNWDGQDAMPQLWAAVARVGNVMAARVAQESSWTARARGITGVQLYDQDESSEGYEEEDDDSLPHSRAWWGDYISGCPSSLEETVMAFLDNGFHPATNAMLSDKLHIVAKKTVKSCTSKSRVKVPMSCSALIVPGMTLP
jgi:RNA-dependent RNA polymerase